MLAMSMRTIRSRRSTRTSIWRPSASVQSLAVRRMSSGELVLSQLWTSLKVILGAARSVSWAAEAVPMEASSRDETTAMAIARIRMVISFFNLRPEMGQDQGFLPEYPFIHFCQGLSIVIVHKYFPVFLKRSILQSFPRAINQLDNESKIVHRCNHLPQHLATS